MSYNEQQLNIIFQSYNNQADSAIFRLSNTLLYSDVFFFYCMLISTIAMIFGFISEDFINIARNLVGTTSICMCLFSMTLLWLFSLDDKLCKPISSTFQKNTIKDNVIMQDVSSYLHSIPFHFTIFFVGISILTFNTEIILFMIPVVISVILKIINLQTTLHFKKECVAYNWTGRPR